MASNNLNSGLAQWLGTLPLVDSVKSASLIHAKISTLLHESFSLQDKSELLYLFYAPYFTIEKSIREHLLRCSPITAAKERERVYWATQLPLSLATAYASLLQHQIKTNDVNTRFMLKALFWAGFYLHEVLTASYLLYTSLPTHFWQNLNLIYSLAEKYNLNNSVVDNPTEFKSIEHIYKTCILLSTVSPYQFRRKEMQKLYSIILKRASLLEISAHLDKAQFVVELHKDNAPIFKQLFSGTNKDYTRGIDLRGFLQAIQSLLKQYSDDPYAQQTGLSKTSLEKALYSWTTFTNKGNREKANLLISIFPGLTNIYQILIQENITPRSESNSNETFNFSSSEPSFHIGEVNPWENFSTTNPAPMTKEFTPSQANIHTEVVVKDKNEKGMLIETNIKNVDSLHPYELIGFCQKTSINEKIGIGNIRWFKLINENTIHLGVKILAQQSLPVVIFKEECGTQSSLLLPSQGDETPSTILVPSLQFKSFDKLLLSYKSHSFELVLLKPYIINNQFFQFSYQLAENANPENQNAILKDLEKETPDDLWNMIEQA